MDDNIRFMRMLQHQYCGTCVRPVNLPLLIQRNECANIIIVNYHSPPPQHQNRAVIFCCTDCQDRFKEFGPIHCVVCNKQRKTPKWDVEIVFEKLGGWRSIRGVCSKKCKNSIKKESANKTKSITCWTCGKDHKGNELIPRCSRCKVARYCNIACQKRHWPVHKHNCQKTS